MKSARRRAPLVLSLAVLAACGSDDPTQVEDGITVADLVGSWSATSDLHANNANPGQTFDVIGAGGDVSVTVLTGGRARTWVTLGTFSDEWDASITISGNTLTSDPVEAGRPTRTWEITLVDGVLTMTDTQATFDFTLTGATPVSSTEVIVLVRG